MSLKTTLRKIKRKHLVFVGLLLLLTGFTLLFVYIPPQELIEMIGVRNGYLIISGFSLFGGFSALTSFSFYATVVTFTLGGLNPFVLTLSAAPGLFIGDSVYYYFGNVMKQVLPEKIQHFIDRMTEFIYRPKVYRFSPFIIYLYVGISPLPPDVLIVALSLSKYPFKKMIIPLLLGEMTFVLLVSLLAQQGIVFYAE